MGILFHTHETSISLYSRLAQGGDRYLPKKPVDTGKIFRQHAKLLGFLLSLADVCRVPKVDCLLKPMQK